VRGAALVQRHFFGTHFLGRAGSVRVGVVIGLVDPGSARAGGGRACGGGQEQRLAVWSTVLPKGCGRQDRGQDSLRRTRAGSVELESPVRSDDCTMRVDRITLRIPAGNRVPYPLAGMSRRTPIR